MMNDRKPELLMPAGGMETLKVAVNYGADAVYMGGSSFGLRAKADNFTIEEMKQAVEYAHAHNVKVYVTVNIFAHNEDVEGLKKYFGEIKDIGIDAVLIADPGVFSLAREIMPDMEIHISTQANNTNPTSMTPHRITQIFPMSFGFRRGKGSRNIIAIVSSAAAGAIVGFHENRQTAPWTTGRNSAESVTGNP